MPGRSPGEKEKEREREGERERKHSLVYFVRSRLDPTYNLVVIYGYKNA